MSVWFKTVDVLVDEKRTVVVYIRNVLWVIVFMSWFPEPAWASSDTVPVPQEGYWFTTTNGCEVWRGKESANVVATWDGWCTDGMVSGRGRLTYEYEENGKRVASQFDGEMVAGKPNGEATFKKPDGTHYEGEFKGGWAHGHGKATYSSGISYEGEFVNGFPHGFGVMIYSDIRYEGQFENGAAQGSGLEVYPNGDRYEGQFEHDARHGHGQYTWSGGHTYEGNFVNGLPHGVGQCQAHYQWQKCNFEYGEFVVAK